MIIIRLKKFSSQIPTAIKNPKPKILGEKSKEITSKNGVRFRRRLDEDTNLNLGKELKELEKEKRELSSGLNKEEI